MDTKNMRAFNDELYWRDLAKKYGVRLVKKTVTNKGRSLKRIAKKMGIDVNVYMDTLGLVGGKHMTVKKLVSINESFPAFAFQGLFLEWFDEQRGIN